MFRGRGRGKGWKGYGNMTRSFVTQNICLHKTTYIMCWKADVSQGEGVIFCENLTKADKGVNLYQILTDVFCELSLIDNETTTHMTCKMCEDLLKVNTFSQPVTARDNTFLIYFTKFYLINIMLLTLIIATIMIRQKLDNWFWDSAFWTQLPNLPIWCVPVV